MKEIRLEIPLKVWKKLPSNRMWLRVEEDHTEAFEDREFRNPIQKERENVVLYINVPKQLSLIEVIGLGGTTPIEQITMGWIMEQANPNWRVLGLKEVTIITRDSKYDIPIIEKRPDIESIEALENLWPLDWAMEVYTLEDKTIAAFHWHPSLIQEVKNQILPICFSKKDNSPGIFEKGGYRRGKAYAIIVCDKEGKRKEQTYAIKQPINSSGELMVGINEKDVITKLEYKKKESAISIELCQVKAIHEKFGEMEVKTIARNYPCYDKDITLQEWKKRMMKKKIYWYMGEDIVPIYQEAILAAFEKAANFYR